tara:strand:+ start:3596 stop:3898 length:303 start_codon:yes stop_codon:yes gene_type:complete
MTGTIEQIKSNLPPERYYPAHLPGSLGKPTGKCWHRWNGLCPFHGDRRPGSFFINRASGAFRCFSCGASGGDIIAFHRKANRLGFKEALAQLKEIARCAR